LEKLQTTTTYNIFQILKLSISLEDMGLLIQQRHGPLVQRGFITGFSEIRSEGQVVVTLRYVKQKKYESTEDYYDQFL
jgi:hypothetical protein